MEPLIFADRSNNDTIIDKMSLKVSAVETLPKVNTQYVLFSGKTDILNSKKKTKLSVICTVPALYRSSPTSRNGPSKIMFNFWLSIFNIYSESILDLVSNERTQWPVTAEVQNRKLFAFTNMQFKYNIKCDGPSLMAFTHFNEPGNFKPIESYIRPDFSLEPCSKQPYLKIFMPSNLAFMMLPK